MNNDARRGLLILVAALTALIVALVTAWLVASDGAPFQTALLSAGGAFGGTMTLIIFVLKAAGMLDTRE